VSQTSGDVSAWDISLVYGFNILSHRIQKSSVLNCRPMFSIYAIAHIIINNTYVYTIGYTDRAMTHIVSCTQARAEFLKGGLRAVSHSFFSFIHSFELLTKWWQQATRMTPFFAIPKQSNWIFAIGHTSAGDCSNIPAAWYSMHSPAAGHGEAQPQNAFCACMHVQSEHKKEYMCAQWLYFSRTIQYDFKWDL